MTLVFMQALSEEMNELMEVQILLFHFSLCLQSHILFLNKFLFFFLLSCLRSSLHLFDLNTDLFLFVFIKWPSSQIIYRDFLRMWRLKSCTALLSHLLNVAINKNIFVIKIKTITEFIYLIWISILEKNSIRIQQVKNISEYIDIEHYYCSFLFSLLFQKLRYL
jgi:hypothetical protein